jgi:hypothetical protein
MDGNEIVAALNNARANRDIERLRTALFKPPAMVAPFLTLPDVFLLITVSLNGSI